MNQTNQMTKPNYFTEYIPNSDWDTKTKNYVFNDTIDGVIHPMIQVMDALNFASGYFASRNNKYIRSSSHKNCRFGNQGDERFIGNFCVLGLVDKLKKNPTLFHSYPNPTSLSLLEFEQTCLNILLTDALNMFDWYPYFSWPKFLSYLCDFRSGKGQMPYAKDLLIKFFSDMNIPMKFIHKIIKSDEPAFIADKENAPKKTKGCSLDYEDRIAQWGVYYHSRWWFVNKWYNETNESKTEEPEETNEPKSDDSEPETKVDIPYQETQDVPDVPESWEDNC